MLLSFDICTYLKRLILLQLSYCYPLAVKLTIWICQSSAKISVLDGTQTLFLKLPKLPDYVKTEHVFVSPDLKTSFYSVYELPEDKYFEGMKAIVKRYTGYNEVEGYEYRIVPVMEAKDALALIGFWNY